MLSRIFRGSEMRYFLAAILLLTGCGEDEYASQRCKRARLVASMAIAESDQLAAIGLTSAELRALQSANLREYISEHSECFKSGL